jgi:alcohol dehydrogenase (cytochrome c)
MKYNSSSIIFCSGQAFKATVVLSISLVIMLSFLFLLTSSFAYVEARLQHEEQQQQQQRDTLVETAATTTIIGVKKQQNQFLDQNIPDLRYDHNSPSSNTFNSELGTESKNNNNWITVNHDMYGTRSSNQTVIKKDNVNALQVKWRLISDVQIQDPPITVGNRGYVQDYSGTIIAFDTTNGKVLWKVHAGGGPTMGLTFNRGLVFSAIGYNSTVVAINATNGMIVWQSPALGNSKIGYHITTQPIVWKDYVIVGSAAHGDDTNGVLLVQGNITALNATNGRIIWNIHTTAGDWVRPGKAPAYNGDASAWSGGSIDPETGIMYVPLGSPSPNFNATTRKGPNLYANHMIAVNVTNGKMIWATPFIDYGTVLNVRVPDTHDWDTSWGSSISKVTFDNGTQKKIVIGHDKMGNIIAMDATTGKEIWWKTLGKQYNTDLIPSSNGSGIVWSYGIFNYHAIDNDNNTLYIAATNRGVNYFTDKGVAGHRVAAPHTIDLGLRNGTIAAMDLRTGKIKWQYQTEFPPRVSPLVTDDIVFAGYIPFTEKVKSKSSTTTTTAISPNPTRTVKSGVILALDKQTGKKLWEYNVNAPISIVGPSIGNGMLFVPTGKIQGQEAKGIPKGGGSIVAFGLP